jgi:hypothetical protein
MKKYFSHFKDREFLISAITAVFLLVLSLVINFYAGTYATEKISNSVTDIVLSNIRIFDVDGVFVYGAILFWIFIAFLCFLKPKTIPFTFKSIALFIVIRSIFVSLTHIGPFPGSVIVSSSNIFQKVSFGGDLFFSGHTGLPFLMALVFWDNKYLRYIFLASSLIFAIVVLLGHYHYSIDVLSAFFITYTIFNISLFLFRRDRKIFLS